MLKVHCRTNLDAYAQEVWPSELCCRPMVGDMIESRSHTRLQICEITHCPPSDACSPLRSSFWSVSAIYSKDSFYKK
ncbi:hypothetical protein LCGC14_1642670 [marine sediment metagenome]|uniref:Uncharacterized protein n=1 Tax=marine sediment metagenome TaxID=412755 RepID=A0A0F9HZX3_9ZZZZ